VRPALFTFDIFGTVLDWMGGMRAAVAAATGREPTGAELEQVVDWQGGAEQRRPFLDYRDICAASLVAVLGVDLAAADAIAARAGTWPLFPDSAEGLRRLLRVAPCVAMTNSDRLHRAQIEAQLGFRLSAWICAEDLGCYKPSRQFWRETARRLGARFGRGWWHVSAYADYDLCAASALGLTAVFVQRPHCRRGPAHLAAPDLRALAERAKALP
jgi:putative hydrolase of the HAD superfamily